MSNLSAVIFVVLLLSVMLWKLVRPGRGSGSGGDGGSFWDGGSWDGSSADSGGDGGGGGD